MFFGVWESLHIMVGGLQSQFFANFILNGILCHSDDSCFLEAFAYRRVQFFALLFLQPHPCQSPLVFHVTTDHVHCLRRPGPAISVKDQIPKPCFKARRGTHRAMSGRARSQRVD